MTGVTGNLRSLPTKSTNPSDDLLNSSENFEVTEPDPSLPVQTAQPFSTSIRYEDRIFLTGATRSGKSTLAKQLFLSTTAPRLVVDPADSSLTASVVDVGGTFSNPNRIPDVATARFVPTDPDDLDAYDTLFKRLFLRYPGYVWLDEAAQVAPASGYPKAVNRYIVQGAKRMLGLIACHTRPREVAVNLIAQASHVFVFDLPNPDDRRHIANIVGLPLATLDSAINELESKGFLWWNGNARTLTICPPLSGVS